MEAVIMTAWTYEAVFCAPATPATNFYPIKPAVAVSTRLQRIYYIIPIFVHASFCCSYLAAAADIDECVVANGGCDHTCVNTDGGRTCSCDPGYSLGSDEESCDGEYVVCHWLIVDPVH